MCFIARPADGEFQLEEDILRQLLTERNYDTYVAIQKIDPGNFAFCTKICSRIIISHFSIVILNSSAHAENPELKIPNPNVHLEYGMMLSFHKHIIPMQRETETLAFNIYPLDTIKYRPEDFKQKAEAAIDDAILRVQTKEPPGRAIGPASEVLKYLAFRGLRFSDVDQADAKAVFQLGSMLGFNLFDGLEEIVFLGYFPKEEPREIAARVRFLLNNIAVAYRRVQSSDEEVRATARRILEQLTIEVVVPEDAPADRILAKIDEFQPQVRTIPVALKKLSEIEQAVREEYDQLEL